MAERDEAFARMRFSGRHVGVFRGEPPTGRVDATRLRNRQQLPIQAG